MLEHGLGQASLGPIVGFSCSLVTTRFFSSALQDHENSRYKVIASKLGKPEKAVGANKVVVFKKSLY